MMKISALNEAPRARPENDDEDVQTISKEAQEQIALTEYNRALELMNGSNVQDALTIFRDLLDTELLDQVEKFEIPDGRSRPMLSLKYSCFKNIGAIQATLENYEEAIENYWEAGNLDDTDVMLWYRIGCLAMTISNLELACSSFKQGLKRNPNHWPCLDNIISALYAVPDYTNCLLFVSMALERDPSYVKGLAFRERIFKDVPYFEESYKLYNVDWALDPPLDTEFDRILGEKFLAEAKEISRKWAEACRSEFVQKTLPTLSPNKPLSKSTWLELGESLVNMHKWMAENSHNFVSRVTLDFQKPVEEESGVSFAEEEINNAEDIEDPEMDASEDGSVGTKIDTDMENLDVESKRETDIEEMDILENSDDQRAPTTDYDTEVKSEVEDDVQIIEDEDPFKIPHAESLRSDKNTEDQEKHSEEALDFPEAMIVGDDEDAETSPAEKISNEPGNGDKSNEEHADKSNHGSSDKSSEKLNDKSNDKTFKAEEKSNERSEGKEEGQKVKKRRRSSLCFLQQWAWSSSSMRRSARVRGSNRKEAERDDVQLEETLRRMFPSTLLPDGVKLTKDDPFKNIDDSMDTMDLYQLFANRENNCTLTEGSKSTESSKPSSPDANEQPKYFGTEMEKTDVDEFINEHSGKSNLMIIIAKFTEFMSTKWNYEWPKEMGQVYLQAYSFTREHIPHPSPFGEDEEDHGILKYDAEMTLLFGELHTDRWMDDKPDVLATSNLDRLGTGMPSEELGHIIFASVRDDLFNEENTIYLLRVLWLKANIFHCQGETDIVIQTLELLLNHMEEFQQRHTPLPSVKLPNCKYNSRINIPVIQKMLTAIRRGQKLGEVQRLYDEEKYAELAATLQDTFKFARQRQKFVPHIKVTTDRIDQLAMLLDSLWKLERYEECYVWAEACLNESWQNYLNVNEESEQKKWAASVVKCLDKIEACVSEVSTFVVGYLPESRLARFVQNLVQMVCHQLDVTELAIEMPLETVLPWIILHYILQYEEDKERAKLPSQKTKEQNSESDDDDDEDIPTSIMILLTAHEFLGRHSWCCINEAKLLIFTMKLVIPLLRTPQFASVRGKLGRHLEQIFYCLYGHPSKEKKTKPKYLEDHRVPQIELTWEGAQLLFDFYRPDVLPEYDTPRAASINADTHSLFKKIISLVPEEHDPSAKIDEVTAYIVGDREKMPNVEKPLPYQVSSLYALLGDYLFKYNQYSNSTCYFLMDICLHPEAFNSWATLAMVTSTEFGTALTSCKPLPDIKKLLFEAKIAQCCYRRAVELVPAQSVIWIEYGTFAYTVHSFCSRLLKQETDTLSMERFAALESRKEDTLEIAVNCFISANRMFLTNIDDHSNVHDERWLYHYMLAKIAEKKNNDPPIYLDHYAKASDWLRKNNAHYPRRLQHKNPHYLSVEALEVHYRIHACILKYLEQHEGKALQKSLGRVFTSQLTDCSNGPFMQYESKLNGSKRADDNGYPEAVYSETNVSDVPRSRTGNQERRLNSVEEIPAPERTESAKASRSETRKRQAETHHDDSGKRIKLGSVSHLQLMQDVVGLIDDLITNVCKIVARRDGSGDEVVILSSDESEKASRVAFKDDERKKERVRNIGDERVSSYVEERLPRCTYPEEKGENVQDVMDALMKRAMEISSEAQHSPPDEDETRKSEGKWLQNEDVQSVEAGRYYPGKTDKESKDRSVDKKKSQVNSVKDEVTLSRRGSQESNTTTQTTTTTETNNSSSSSSDESSSSDDSSESDTSSDRDSESADSEADKKKSTLEAGEKEEYLTEAEVGKLIAYCLAGLEQCVLRFPEHYKSIYRLCHYFFNNKAAKDNAKCRDLLLGTYKCQYYSGLTFQGLFADRKSTNFFNGVWRNPIEEIDRPGSFASHMSRCVTLLMQILKETDDSWMLMELCVQLRKIPDAEKKYLRDSEREQLSRQAQTLCLQSLRVRIHNMPPASASVENMHAFRTDPRKQVLLDVYKIYREVQKTFQGKDSTIQAFAALLVDTYKAYTGVKNIEGNGLEVALKCCHQTLLASKIAASNSIPTTSIATAPATSSSPVATSQPQSLPTSPQTQHTRKPYKSSTSTGRPRGRPPNANKYLQAMQQSGSLGGQFNAKGAAFGNYLGISDANRTLMNSYFMNSLMDSSMLSTAFLSAGLGGNMLESLNVVNCLNQMGYQDIIRHYQNNLSSISNLATAGYGNIPTSMTTSGTSSVSTPSAASSGVGGVAGTGNLGNMASMGNLGNLTVQQLLDLSNSTASTTRATPMYHQSGSKATTTTSSTKEAPSVSITPVGSGLQQHKTKASKHGSSHNEPLPAHISKSMPMPQGTAKSGSHPPATQVSLLKPSVIQQTKSAPPKQMCAPHLRVSKSLTEPQPAHNSSVLHSSLNSGNPNANLGSVPQAAHTVLQGPSSLNMKPTVSMGLPPSRGGGTTLQHKLLSKKMAQQSQSLQPPKVQSCPSTKKQKVPKVVIPQLPNNLQSLLSTMSTVGAMGQTPFIPPDLSGISVSAVGQSVQKPPPPPKHPPFRKVSSKTKSATLEIPGAMQNPMPSANTAETLSMLSQLQQNSHLEIIPQQKSHSKANQGDYSKNMPVSLSVVTPQKLAENIRPTSSDCMSVFELSRSKSNSNPSKKQDSKHAKESVEIITLDD